MACYLTFIVCADGAAIVVLSLLARYRTQSHRRGMAVHPLMMACAVVCGAEMHISVHAAAVSNLTSMAVAVDWASPRPLRSHDHFIKRLVKAVMAPAGTHGRSEKAVRFARRVLMNISDAVGRDPITCGDTEFVLGKSVSSGNFGDVYEDDSNPDRAIKVMFKLREGPDAVYENFVNECAIMQQLQGRLRVPQCYATCDFESVKLGKTQALVMEFIRDTKSLHQVNLDARNAKPARGDWPRIGHQLYTSMMAMLGQGIVNNDQTSNNILIDAKSNVVFIDMGKAATVSTWRAYYAARKLANNPLPEASSGESWMGQVDATVRAIFGAVLKHVVCPNDADGKTRCRVAAEAMQSAVAAAVCDDTTTWMAYRYSSMQKSAWCTFTVTTRQSSGKKWSDNSCDAEGSACGEDDVGKCPYLMRERMMDALPNSASAKKQAGECLEKGSTGRLSESVGAVEALPAFFRSDPQFK